MIIKASQRRFGNLADHLTHDENEIVRHVRSRGLYVDSVHRGMAYMTAIASAFPQVQKPVFHISMSPSTPLTEQQWARAFAVYEGEFNLDDYMYIEIEHLKRDGRPAHRHRAYLRIGADGKALRLSHTHIRNEKCARILEYEFGHPLTIGRFNRTIIKHLEAEGQGAISSWMRAQEVHLRYRPSAIQSDQDTQQQKRTQVSIKQVRADLQEAWAEATNAQEFLRLLLQRGYILAQGRKKYVICDSTGNVHSPRRRLDVRAGVLRAFFADLVQEHLPTVEQVQQAVKALRGLELEREAGRAETLMPEQKAVIQQYLLSSGLVKAI
ncbi:MAG: relaxase/mobilization nuclease domain-containing protein [Cyanobacteria bacterium P01_D01_bin.56]